MAEVVMGSLTDEMILDYTADRVIATNVDFNLKKSSLNDDGESFTLHPEPKGIYDPKYFGSIYAKSCNCGRIKKVGVVCELCGSMLMTDDMAYNRFARIDMGFYHSSKLKSEALLKYLKSNYSCVLEFDKEYPLFDFVIVKGTEENPIYALDLEPALYLAVIRWDKKKKSLVFSNKITDPSKIGLDSLVVALQDAGDDNWKKYLNKYIIVTPARMRPVSIRRVGSQKQLMIPDSSNYYSALAWLSDNVSWELSKYYAKGSAVTPEDTCKMAIKKAAACMCIKASESKLSDITASSKANIARYSYKIRQPNSGRSVITGDPTLRIDEVGIPIHLAYEALKTDFINYIKTELRLKRAEANQRYANPDNLIMDMFKDYAEKRKVLLNRAPTLHKYNILSMNIKLVEDSSIHLPILSTGPFNADFDGDTMSFFVIPKDIEDYVEDLMSPRNIKVYEKNSDFMFKPNHEVLNGLSLVTKMVRGSEIRTIDDLAVAKELIDDRKLEVYSVIKYKGRETTWGREKVSRIIEASLDHVIGPKKIDDRNINEVYALINKYDNETRTQMIKSLQDFALEWVTEYGVSTLTLGELAESVDHEFRPMVDGVLKNPELDDKAKFVKAKKMYDDRIHFIEKNKKLVEKVTESYRGKMNQIFDMSVPQFMTTDDGKIVIPQKPLVEGLTEREYVTHSYNNRRLLAIKSLSVPAGGYFTRQLVFTCQSLVINVDSDPDNYGIELPRYRCEGRTTTSGELIGKSLVQDDHDLVRVRSIVVAKNGIVSTDMFSNKYGFDRDNSRVGISFASSFTESLTQDLLALKHGGAMKKIPSDFIIKAPDECDLISVTDNTYEIKLLNGATKMYPLSSSMRFVEGTGEHKKHYLKGSDMVELVNPLPPTLNLEMAIKLIGAQSVLNRNSMTRADVPLAESYTIKGGKIHYDLPNGTVTIGDKTYDYDDEAAYYYAEGDELPPITKFRSGLMTPNMVLPSNPTNEDIVNAYYTYRDQIYRVKGKNAVNEELIETVFRASMIDGKHKSVQIAAKHNASALTSISYGWASRSILDVIQEPQVLKNDPMTNVLLNYMMKEAAHKS